MMLLTGSRDESTIIVLSNDSEIEIIELEGSKPGVVIYADEAVSIVRKYLANPD